MAVKCKIVRSRKICEKPNLFQSGFLGRQPFISFLPTDLIGLTLWLDDPNNSQNIIESALRVSQWTDISGNSNHFVQATGLDQPLRTGSEIIADGASEFLESDSNIANFNESQGEWIIIFRDIGGTGTFCLPVNFGDASDDTNFLVFGIIPADKFNIQSSTNNIQWDITARSLTYLASFISTGTEYKLFIDGVDQGAPTVTAGANDGEFPADIAGLDTISLYSLIRPTPIFTNTGISTALNYNRELTVAERLNTNRFLNDRFNLGLSL